MLFDLKRILGPHDLSKDQTAEWFLGTQFLSGLPTDVQHILAAFQNASIEELAKTADSVISSQNTSFKSTNMSNSSTLATPACSLRSLDQSYLSELTDVKQQLKSLQMQLNQSLSSSSYSTVPQHHRPQSFPHQNYMRRGAPSFNRSRFPDLSFRPPFSRPPVPSTTRQELVDGLCYYHRKYSSSARRCVPECSRYNEHLRQASLLHVPSLQASFHYQITTAAAGTSHQYDSYIHLQDIHNNIKFIVDTASPKSILPVSLFPSFATQHISSSCPSLFAANGIALQQAGSLELTLHFSEFPNRHFIHTFILAQIECPILGLDFFSRYHFTINASLKTVDCEMDIEHECKDDSQSLLQPIDFDTFSFEEILQLYPDVTSGHIKIGKKLHPFAHILEVSGPPVAFRPRRLNAEKQKALDAILDDLLAKKIISPTSSSWSSPVHMVKKKDGSYRLVHDYRVINERCEKQHYLLPRLTDFTRHIHGATIFSSLDLKNGFWQLDVRPSDRKYTAFCTHRGNCLYNKLLQGLTYASSSFQRFINQVLSGTSSFCFAYIDDLVIFSSDDRQHKQHLHEIATRLNLYGLTLNMAKCVIGVNELEVLGYNLSAEGITATDHKIKAIKSFFEPTTIKELRRLLGLINYQRRFIPDAAAILAPLNSYLQGDDAKQALERIKQAIIQLVCLAHPRHDAQLQLKRDASNLDLGVVLEQVFDDTTEVLGYFSKSLTETQRKYSTYDLELLSIFSCEAFRIHAVGQDIHHIMRQQAIGE